MCYCTLVEPATVPVYSNFLKNLISFILCFKFRASGVTASFGEMLLLMAIHFHSNQLSAIIDLVCSTLGMKVLSRSNNMSKIKHLFTQDVFTEQVFSYSLNHSTK